jgi:hypothetical protein
MDGITAAHVVKILLYAQKQSHYTAAFLFYFWRNFDKKKPSATSRKELKKRTSRTFAIFLRKKRKKRKNLPDLDGEYV